MFRMPITAMVQIEASYDAMHLQRRETASCVFSCRTARIRSRGTTKRGRYGG